MSFLPYVFGAIFCIVGIGLTAGGFGARKKSKVSASWPTVVGKILSTDVVAHRSSGGGRHGSSVRSSYEPVVKYSYSVGDKNFEGKKIGFVDIRGSKGSAEKRVESFSSMKELIVHYNPDSPKEAVLDPKATGSGGLFGIGIVLALIGILILFNAQAFSVLFSI
jgi:hypothetical protein